MQLTDERLLVGCRRSIFSPTISCTLEAYPGEKAISINPLLFIASQRQATVNRDDLSSDVVVRFYK